MTEPEYLALQHEAYEKGQTMSEWGRDKMLAESGSYRDGSISKHIFTELVGLQLLLINALPPLLRGEHMLAEQIESLKRRVQTIKRTKAQELLAKRAEENEANGRRTTLREGPTPPFDPPRALREL